ncbi:Wzz/FepE/Etk N-terminal domain-containing protein [Nocardioides sp. cx-173]|uniref:Wzz/FepE/Etk N-terminal domain-containing protein n=1 Tax=Nocardioides sp. cx-173 TaxID=2898796 RepID=UPI001E424F59|nr:Wzz/FepE/Etk N-terminal domain-containing protein [Nocardioides sp. cx-173]MCD4526286.1 Wzz/FepE/Etk N-terminal domain-containing protein [Nocardioides sp. cx-173]UGB40506.1 Wzz/FepE/Etk N-terminal domain-containing protein [Nocardioides sp. cx-173]
MELRDVAGALWRQKVLVVLVLVATAAAVTAGLMVAPKSYTSTATVAATAAPDTTTSSEDLDDLRGTLGEVANSRAVLEEVQTRLDAPRTLDQLRREISGAWVEGTILVQVTVEDGDPETAARIANLVAEVLPLHDPSNGAFLFTTSNPAQVPLTYSSPNLLLGIGVGALLALVLAVSAALVRDRRATTVTGVPSVEAAASAPVLARVAAPRDPTTLPALYPGTSAAAVFRQLRIALEAEASTEPVHRIVVTGVTTADVNVWLGANLAISLANAGRRVLMVDGRMGERHGKPIVGGPETTGLYEVLTGGELDSALSPGPVQNLTVLPSGSWGGEPTDVLVETRFSEAMDAMAARFDVVVVLAPPLDVGDDARVMGRGGSMLLAVPEGSVSTAQLRTHVGRVRTAGVRLLGTVLVTRRGERVAA